MICVERCIYRGIYGLTWQGTLSDHHPNALSIVHPVVLQVATGAGPAFAPTTAMKMVARDTRSLVTLLFLPQELAIVGKGGPSKRRNAQVKNHNLSDHATARPACRLRGTLILQLAAAGRRLIRLLSIFMHTPMSKGSAPEQILNRSYSKLKQGKAASGVTLFNLQVLIFLIFWGQI